MLYLHLRHGIFFAGGLILGAGEHGLGDLLKRAGFLIGRRPAFLELIDGDAALEVIAQGSDDGIKISRGREAYDLFRSGADFVRVKSFR